MPSRRAFLARTMGLIGAVQPYRAPAASPCPKSPAQSPLARSACVDIARFCQPVDGPRSDAAAAWVACVATVFAVYGHGVLQSRVAADAYGDLAAVGVHRGFAVARPLDRMWTDDNGVMFRVAVEALYDGSLPGARPDPPALVEALAAGDPIILWSGERPVVLSALEIVRSADAWTARGGLVFDPVSGTRPREPNENERRTSVRGGPHAFAMRVTFPGLG